jgi:predicted metal-binding protein
MEKASATLYICRVCGQPKGLNGTKPTNPVAATLQQALAPVLAESDVRVELTDCLAVCIRPLAWALTGQGRHSFTFAAQDEVPPPEAFVALAQTYLATPLGEKMKKADFPPAMKGTLISRVPPLK